MKCRNCNSSDVFEVIDLGFSPPSNAFLSEINLHQAEVHYPLKVFVCLICWLCQTEDFVTSSQVFDESYVYFSSTSSSWLEHAKKYVDEVVDRFEINQTSMVTEIASNDGYLLKNFIEKQINCYGIEPTKSTASVSKALGIPTIEEFFSLALAQDLVNKGKSADLIIGNNVFAHVPDINNFTAGLAHLLTRDGVITLEFPHLLELLRFDQFDTIYHEHFSYLSLIAIERIFAQHNLRLFDIQRLPTHGGSLRVFGCRHDAKWERLASVEDFISEEKNYGLDKFETYSRLQVSAQRIKQTFLRFLLDQKSLGKRVIGYGAAAKGNTLLNYCGVRPDLVELIIDAAPSKQNMYLPGSHIPVKSPEEILVRKNDVFVIFPWNLADEIVKNIRTRYPNAAECWVVVPEVKRLF
jgi:hypothetical protein